MPQASDADRDAILKLFQTLDTAPVIKELELRHFTLTKEWCWQRARIPTEFEWKLIKFLIDEWDFGGYIED